MKKIYLLFSLLLSIIGANAQNLAEIEAKADQKVEHYGFTEAFRDYLTCIEQSKDIDTHIRIIKKVTKVIDEKRIYINKEALQAIDTLIKKIHPLYGSDCKYYLPLIEKRIIILSQYGGDYKREVFLYNEAIDIRTSNNLLQGAEYEELLSWFMKISVYRKDVSNEDRLKICSDLKDVHKLNNLKIDSLYIDLVNSYSGKCHLSKDYQTSIEILELKRIFIEAKGEENSKEYIKTLEHLTLYNGLHHKELYGEKSNYMSSQKEKAIHYNYELLKLKISMGITIQFYEITSLLLDIERFKKDTRETLKVANELKALLSQCSNNENKKLIETIESEIVKYASCTQSAEYLFIELLQQKFPNDSTFKSFGALGIINDPLDYFKDTITARTVARDFKALLEEMYGKENAAYCDALEMETETYDEENDTTAIPLLRELLSLQEKVFGKEHYSYQYTQVRLTSALSNSHQKQGAIDVLSENTDEEDISGLFLLASEQSNYGLHRESIKTYEKIIKHCISKSDQLAPIYINSSFMTIAITYNQLKDLDGLIDFGTRWSKEPLLDKKAKESLIRNVIEWAINLDNTGENVINFIDNHLSSVTTQIEVLEYKAAIYRKNNQGAKAEEAIRQIIAQLKENNSDIGINAKYEQYLEICLISKGAYNEAIEQHKKVASLVKALPDYQNSIEYHTLCCCDIIYNYRDNNFDEIIRLYKECSKFNFINYYAQKQSNGKSSIRIYSNFNITIAYIEALYYSALYKKNKTEEAEILLNKDYEDVISSIKFNYTSMNKDASKFASPIHHILFSFTNLSKKDSLCIKAFDYTLLYKQGFLTTETLMNQQLLKSNNQELLQKFNNLQNIRIAIQQYEVAGLPCEELKEQELILHTQLTEDSKIYGDFTKSLNLTWDSIRKTLKPDEIAIEFVNYKSLNDSSENIAALLLRADWEAPKIVNLFSTKQLPKNIYENNEFSKLCWEPICKYLNGVKNIYFAPAGILYNLGIESLLSPEGDAYMSEKYNLYRLSSTRELAMRANKNSSDISNAVIYGGIDYKQENSETMPTAEQTEETNSNIELIRDIRGSVSGINYLPGTKIEAESIAKILIANNKCNEAKLLTGKTGTEHSFKSISGENIKIIHIATHGFYYKDNNNIETQSLTNVLQSESEDKSLTRSGLLFAGAEKTIFNDSQQPSNNDGILTALEISTMDLRALDIVTLSACQTGQGDITNEGVFGLQRGFKKAGANSILMSLWSVDDRATTLLMTEFYKNWIAGKSKHDALEIAKQSVKTHKENGWDNPKYWAAFILLDGLD